MEYTFEARVNTVTQWDNGDRSSPFGIPGDKAKGASWSADSEDFALHVNADVPTPPVGTRFKVTLVAIEED